MTKPTKNTHFLFIFQRATETLLCGKSALVCGYGEVGKGVVSALKSLGCILFVSEADPICALQVLSNFRYHVVFLGIFKNFP